MNCLVVVAIDPIFWVFALWIEDHFCEMWAGYDWFPLAAMG